MWNVCLVSSFLQLYTYSRYCSILPHSTEGHKCINGDPFVGTATVFHSRSELKKCVNPHYISSKLLSLSHSRMYLAHKAVAFDWEGIKVFCILVFVGPDPALEPKWQWLCNGRLSAIGPEENDLCRRCPSSPACRCVCVWWCLNVLHTETVLITLTLRCVWLFQWSLPWSWTVCMGEYVTLGLTQTLN